MIHAVIFDLDGTLINSLPGITASLNRVLDNNGLSTHKESIVLGFIGDGIVKLIERAIPADSSQNQLDRLVSEMKSDYSKNWQQGSTPNPHVIETLKELIARDISVAVFSNKPDIYCKEITDTIFPDITFTKVLGQRDHIPVKPDPAGAYDVAKALDIKPQNIAFLGDSTIDLITAKNAGMLSIAASWGYHDLPRLEKENPDHIIHSMDKLITTIFK